MRVSTKRIGFCFCSALVGILLLAPLAQALPIGFGRNQGSLEYDELTTPNFYVYHDRRAPHEARAVLEALEAARPKLEQWVGVKRGDPLRVLLSASTSNPSFANFITDAIELQTLGRGGRDLAWHEYTHSTMYRHLDNIFGPAGSIIHLPWMPAWWIEGYAEAMSISSGSDSQHGIERVFAMSGRWPTYDKLHSLYDGSRFSNIGYAIAGSFVSYIIRTYGAEKVPAMLEAFYRYSMPWWWPWSVVPFNGFLPMDEALKEYTGKNGEELYREYIEKATERWRGDQSLTYYRDDQSSMKLPEAEKPAPETEAPTGLPGQSVSFSSTVQMQSRQGRLFFINSDKAGDYEAEVVWDKNRSISWKKSMPWPEDALTPRVVRGDLQIFLSGESNENREPIRTFWVMKQGKRTPLFKRRAYISDIYLSRDKLIWVEEYLEQQRICSVSRKVIDGSAKGENSRCSLSFTYPKSMRVLGTKMVKDGEEELLSEIWFSETEETLPGDRHTLSIWKADTEKVEKLPLKERGKPLSLAFTQQGIWLGLADRTHHFLRRIDEQGQCLEERDIGNILEKLHNSTGPELTMSFWEDHGVLLLRSDQKSKAALPCRLHDEPSSPLQLGMRHPDQNLSQILAMSDPWKNREPKLIEAEFQLIAQAVPLGSVKTINGQAIESKAASWRPRPVFAFPWIGVDAKGYQLGTLAVPLMDHMQNETLQLSALYGVESRFPNLELTLSTNRFDTSYSVSVFRRQAWNGVFRNRTYYFDERGAEVQAARYVELIDTSVRVSFTNAWEKPYIGDSEVWPFLAQGYLREFSLGLSRGHSFDWASLSYYLSSNLATKEFNSNYDYEQLGLGTSLGIPIELLGRRTSQNWGMSYSRVRGSKRKLLKEAYRPLRTYVPGSGGGFNEINQSLIGPGALTSAEYGDTQARFQFAWTYPIFYDMAKVIHIVYLQRLDFTAFFNYGTAWFHNDPERPGIYDGVRAHGYNLDLQADIKGVKVNLGLGMGQVLGYDFEVYALFGFDALIDQGSR